MATIKSRLHFPALGQHYAGLSDFAEWVLRAGLGIVLMVHGLQKFIGCCGGAGMGPFIGLLDKFGYPATTPLAYYLATLELVGGFFLVIGFLTRPIAALMFVFMLFAIHYTASTAGHPFVWFRGGSEYSIVIGLVAFYYMIHGAGPWSVDSRMAKEF